MAESDRIPREAFDSLQALLDAVEAAGGEIAAALADHDSTQAEARLAAARRKLDLAWTRLAQAERALRNPQTEGGA